jgi:hypothetical protein
LVSAKHPFLICVVQRRTVLFIRKEVIMNSRPNRNDNDHVLIVTIDVDPGDEPTIRASLLSHLSKSQCA